MNNIDKSRDEQNESYNLRGLFIVDNFKLEEFREIVLEDLVSGQRVKLNKNVYGNRGDLTFDMQLDDQTSVLLPMIKIADNQNPDGDLFKITVGGFVIMFDEEGNLRIDNPNEFQINLDYQKNAGFTELAGKNTIIENAEGLAIIEAGSSGLIDGEMNGHKKFSLLTIRETEGSAYSKYQLRNEDSVGVNVKSGRVVIADGIGGSNSGELAAHLVVEEILIDWNEWKDSVEDAHEKLKVYSQLFYSWKKPNTVAVGCEIKGDKAEMFSLGDAQWMLIRGTKIEKYDERRREFNKAFYNGEISEEELYIGLRSSMISSSFLSYFQPNFDSLELMDGDVLIMFSDGLNSLTDEEILECSQTGSPKDIQKKILDLATQKNQKNVYLHKLQNGKTIELTPPYDNLSMFVYKH